MGKSRNSRYYRDDFEYDNEKAERRRHLDDTRKAKKAKAAVRERTFEPVEEDKQP